MASRHAPDLASDLRRIRKEQGKTQRARLRIVIASDPSRPIRTISLPASLPTIASVIAGTLVVATAILACTSWRSGDARSTLEQRVRSMVQAAENIALHPMRGRRSAEGADSLHALHAPSGERGRFVLQSVNNNEELEVELNLTTGEVDAASYLKLRHLMRCLHTTAETPVDPRLIQLLYRIAQRTQRKIQLVSGFRAPMYSLAQLSYHTRGMAADIRIPGMTALMARDLAESMGVHGLGYYPVSGFIHVDVRDERMRWTDYGQNRFDSERVEHGSARGEILEEADDAASSDSAPVSGTQSQNDPQATL